MQVGRRELVDLSASHSDASIQGSSVVDLHVLNLLGSVEADVMIVGPTAPSHRGLDEATFVRKQGPLAMCPIGPSRAM
jgi:hypothetical protein